jgi:antitermination protein Q
MTTKNELITFIYNSKSINATLNKVTPELRDDFKSHFFLQLLEKDFEKLLEIYNKCETCLEAYAGAIIKLQLKSNTSSFYKIFRKGTAIELTDKHFQEEQPEAEVEFDASFKMNYDNILAMLNHIHPRKSKLFLEHYLNGKTIKQISLQYKIKYTTIHHSIRKTEEYIRQNLKYKE